LDFLQQVRQDEEMAKMIGLLETPWLWIGIAIAAAAGKSMLLWLVDGTRKVQQGHAGALGAGISSARWRAAVGCLSVDGLRRKR
jgi:hypothetical protein